MEEKAGKVRLYLYLYTGSTFGHKHSTFWKIPSQSFKTLTANKFYNILSLKT